MNLRKMNLNDKNEVLNKSYVTLILQNKRFEIDKQALIKKSQYFTNLLSSNYIDRHKSEHVINYDIPLEHFQDFIKWIHGEDIENIIDGKEIDNVLILLEISILFLVDDLTDEIIEKIEQYYQSPDFIIQIWLFAQELGLNILENVCLATCLDRFHEIPQNYIMQLSIENFVKLINNTNLRCEEQYFKTIVQNYGIQNHKVISNKLNVLIFAKQIVMKYEWNINSPKLSSAIASSDGLGINNNIYLHCWNSNYNSHALFELDKFRLPKELVNISNKQENKNLIGMQVVGRGCYLYFIGGEFGIGSGKYNTKIWRYSLLTKKWCCYATMPFNRRHMIAVFIENKLLLVGGVGRFRLKLNSIDIFDIHSGKWYQGAKMPITFTSVPGHYVFSKTLVVYNYILPRNMYIYSPILNVWTIFSFTLGEEFINAPILPLGDFMCYIDDVNPDHLIFNGLKKAEHDMVEAKDIIDISNFLSNHSNSLSFMNIKLRKQHVYFILCYGIQPIYSFKYQFLCWPIHEKNKFRLFFNIPHTFFNLIDPANLHTQKYVDLLVIIHKELQQEKNESTEALRNVNVQHC